MQNSCDNDLELSQLGVVTPPTKNGRNNRYKRKSKSLPLSSKSSSSTDDKLLANIKQMFDSQSSLLDKKFEQMQGSFQELMRRTRENEIACSNIESKLKELDKSVIERFNNVWGILEKIQEKKSETVPKPTSPNQHDEVKVDARQHVIVNPQQQPHMAYPSMVYAQPIIEIPMAFPCMVLPYGGFPTYVPVQYSNPRPFVSIGQNVHVLVKKNH